MSSSSTRTRSRNWRPPTGSATTMPGWWSIISWRNIPTRRRRNPFSPPPASAPGTSGSATAFSSSPPIIPRASPSASRCSTSSATAAVEFGMGESASITELTPFGRDMETKNGSVRGGGPRHVADVRRRRQRASRQVFRHSRCATWCPSRVQKPHPPLWMACSQLPTIERAGQNGFGALGFQFVSADAAHAWVHAYYNAITKRLNEARRLPDQSEHGAGVVLHVRARPTRRPAPRADGATFFQFACASTALAEPPASGARHGQHVGRIQQVEAREPGKRRRRALRGGLIGSPETIRQEAAAVPKPRTSTRSSCSTRPARTATSTSAKSWNCSRRR